MRRVLVLLLALLCVMQASLAVETDRKRSAAPPNGLDMPFLVAPANRGDTLIGFHYISYRLMAPTPADLPDIRNKVAIIQDAFVRDVYKTAVGMANDQTKVDAHTLHDRMIAIARRIAGPKKVSDLVFVDMKFAPIHPKPGGGLFVPSTEGAAPGPGQPKDGHAPEAGGAVSQSGTSSHVQ
ncbi:MAG: hypothetical protein WCD42_06845 [Rhizomicrobium sp.]